MKAKLYYIILIMFMVMLIQQSCHNNDPSADSSIIKFEEPDTLTTGKVRKIFYNMYLPTEMTRIFEKTGANYDPFILNSADNFSRYQTDYKIVVNLGIYGVDMGYTRLFEQKATLAKYFSTIQIMSEKLGIPKDHYDNLMQQLTVAYSDKELLSQLISDIYESTDAFLKENGHDSYAALIVFGGWIEALYIASKIFESNSENIEILDRIAEQKYSLNSLISLLSNFQESIKVSECILMLKQLKNSFEKFEIYYDQEDLQLDTVNKMISTSDYESSISPQIAAEINTLVSEIRQELIN
jgi:hypothetical protein